MTELRGALIGCGFFAVNQMHGWRDVEGADIVAICDRDPRAAEDRRRPVRHRAALYRCGRNVRRRETRFRRYRDHRRRAIGRWSRWRPRHKVPAICQKPFAPTLDDAKAMVEACDDGRRAADGARKFPLAVADPGGEGTCSIAATSASRSSAASRSARATTYSPASPIWPTGKRFIIEDLGIHILDIARFLLGDVTTLTARPRVNPTIAGEDVATMLLDHENGATSVVDCSYATKLAVEPFPETLVEIDGTRGHDPAVAGLPAHVTGRSGTAVNATSSPPLLPWASRPWHNIQESVVAIQQHWVDCLANGQRDRRPRAPTI